MDISEISGILIPIVAIGAIAAFLLILWKIYQPYIDNIRKRRKGLGEIKAMKQNLETPQVDMSKMDAWFDKKFQRASIEGRKRLEEDE